MDVTSLFSYSVWYPLAFCGRTESWLGVHVQTVLYTWVAMAFLLGGAFIIRRYFFEQNGINPKQQLYLDLLK